MLSVTAAQPADLPAILALLDSCGLPRDGLAEHLGSTLVARAGGELVASAAIEPYGAAALLRSIAVAPAYRGRGLGAQMVDAALSLARTLGARQVYLLTTTAPGYFVRFGFHPTSRDAVVPAVRASVEFTGACPASAAVMETMLAAEDRAGVSSARPETRA